MSQLRLILLGAAAAPLRLAAGLAQEAGAQVRLADDPAEALRFARLHGADLLLADVSGDVPGLILSLRQERIAVPVLACGVDAPAPAAVAAVRAGAIDYLPLPPSRELIAAALLTIGHRPVELVGDDAEWRRILSFAERLAPSSAPLLLSGPPGSGKQALARRLHALSGRSGPLVVVDGLAALPPNELRSELFGHRAGAFDGAVADRPGKIVEAAGGSLLVRRADLLCPDIQRDLVRAVAGLPVRLIVTSLARESLQPELGAALSLVDLALPPLSRRGSDRLRLAQHFAARFAAAEGLPTPSFDPAAREAIQAHPWPGNVAELEEVVQRAVLLGAGGTIRSADLVLASGRALGDDTLPVEELVGRSMEEVERALILGTLARCGGNRTSASAILGISVRTMRNKLRALRDDGIAVSPAALA